MSAWTQYKPKLAFYDVLDKPGGVSVDTALKLATQAMERHRADALAALRDAVLNLETAVKAQSAAPEELFAQSLYVLDIAGLFNPALCRAANSLCDLTQRMQAAGRWDWPSAAVHASSMRLLLDRADETDPAAQVVLRGLASVVSKFPEIAPPAPPPIL